MKIRVAKKDLVASLAKAQHIVEKRNSMPILAHVLLEASQEHVNLFATNLEVSLTDQISSPTILEEGRVAVNARSLFEIVKELNDGPVDLVKLENSWLRVVQDKAEYNIVGVSPDEYPVFPTFSTNRFVSIPGDVLQDMIDKTIYSVSTDETRYHLNGVYFETLEDKKGYRMVATDGHRLSVVDRKTDSAANIEHGGVIVPRKGLYEIRKLIETSSGPFEMAVEGSQLIVKIDQSVLMIRLIDGRYPNYRQLIPQNLGEKLLVGRDSLLSSLKRVALMSNQKSKGITLELKSGTLQITSQNPELGDAKEEISVNYSGKDLRIGFNVRYILDVLNSIQEDQISLEFNDQLSPGLLRPTEDLNYTCVVMPMKI